MPFLFYNRIPVEGLTVCSVAFLLNLCSACCKNSRPPNHEIKVNLAISPQTIYQKPYIDDYQHGNRKTAVHGHRGRESNEVCAKIEGEEGN
jgi:hypothetical protein